MSKLAHPACPDGYTRPARQVLAGILMTRLPCQGRISPAAGELLIAVRAVVTSLIGCHGQGFQQDEPGPRLVSCGGQPDPFARRLQAGSGFLVCAPRFWAGGWWRRGLRWSYPGLSACALGWFPQPASRCARPGPARDLSRARATSSWCRLRRRCPAFLGPRETSWPAWAGRCDGSLPARRWL
jgi:hypothetical protein